MRQRLRQRSKVSNIFTSNFPIAALSAHNSCGDSSIIRGWAFTATVFLSSTRTTDESTVKVAQVFFKSVLYHLLGRR